MESRARPQRKCCVLRRPAIRKPLKARDIDRPEREKGAS